MIDFATKQNNVCCAPTQNVATLVRETALRYEIPYMALAKLAKPVELEPLACSALACLHAGGD